MPGAAVRVKLAEEFGSCQLGQGVVNFGEGWTSRNTLWLSGFRSTNIRMVPDFFWATAMLAHQGVGTSTLEITPLVSICSSSSATSSLSGRGTRRGVKRENGTS